MSHVAPDCRQQKIMRKIVKQPFDVELRKKAARDAPLNVLFLDELRRLGFVEGQNLTVEFRMYGNPDLTSRYAAELVNAGVDVIAAAAEEAIRRSSVEQTEAGRIRGGRTLCACVRAWWGGPNKDSPVNSLSRLRPMRQV